MGKFVPPLYGVESTIKTIDKITSIDEQINKLLIQREHYVKELKQSIEKDDNSKA